MTKRQLLYIFATLIAAIAVVAVVLSLNVVQQPLLKVGQSSYNMSVARTNAELEQGLSGTSAIGSKEALLFIFPRDDNWGIWMKDMKYPIDIVWLDANKKIIHTVKDAQPSSYPATTFTPPSPARYVIELKAGAVVGSRITIGEQAVFDDSKGKFL